MRKSTGYRALAFTSASCFALLFAAGSRAEVVPLCESSAQFGSLLDSTEFNKAVQALPPAALLDPPLAPILPEKSFLRNLPAVAQQGTLTQPGSPGSCEAQSFGYGLGSYTAARNANGSLKWDPKFPQNSVSAAFLYALAHKQEGKSCPQGSLALGYLAQLVSNGAPTRQGVPYRPYCSYLDAIQYQADFPNSYPDMRRFRIGSYATIKIKGDANAIERIKQYVANRQAVAFSGRVLCGYGKKVKFRNGVIYETNIVPNSGHGQLVVGYDDKVGVPGRTGALLIQNSFGTSWPPASAGSIAPPGMAYWSYKSFATTQSLAAVAYPRSDIQTGDRLLIKNSYFAPQGAIRRAYQWAPAAGQADYLILSHVFSDPIMLSSVELTEPGTGRVTVAANYGQYISSGYSYLKRADGSAFLEGTYLVTLRGATLGGHAVAYTGAVEIGPSRPARLPGRSMTGAIVTGSTGAPAIISLSH